MTRTAIDRRDNERYRARYQGPDQRWRSRTFDRRVDAQRWRPTSWPSWITVSGSILERGAPRSLRWRSVGWRDGSPFVRALESGTGPT